MVQNLWKQFPRLLLERINGLLDEAEPSSMKAYQLYRSCRTESLWSGNFTNFSKHLTTYFSAPKSSRRKGDFDRYLDRPMDNFIYKDFNLTFRHAIVCQNSIYAVANWAHHLLRISLRIECEVLSTDVLSQTIKDLTQPSLGAKDQNFDFEDFCLSFKKTCFKFFGKKYDPELNHILKELNWLDHQLKSDEERSTEVTLSYPGIYLTQTEIEWTSEVKHAILKHQPTPKFPLSRGPQKQKLIDLDRASTLYNLVLTTNLPELIQQRERIMITVLEICDWLLKDKAA